MATVRIDEVSKHYGNVMAVDRISLDVADREFIVLVGPSGCGKSTTLRMISGLEEISSGTIRIGDRVVNELPPKERDIAMVFQDYALYPHMSVFENMAFGLRYRNYSKDEIHRRVREASRILEIEPLLDRRPKQLSGGQRQRVAMGRAIVRDPQVFLFDEPLSNLDAKLRVQMRTEIKRLHLRVSTTVVYVTHDQVEAMTLADRIVIMRDGIIEQVGTPDEVYNHPATSYVAGFIGAPTMNLFPAGFVRNGDAGVLRLADGRHVDIGPVPQSWSGLAESTRLLVGLRPEEFHADPGPGPSIEVTPDVSESLGSDTLVFFSLAGTELVARLPPRMIDLSNKTLRLRFSPEHLHLFDAATGKAVARGVPLHG